MVELCIYFTNYRYILTHNFSNSQIFYTTDLRRQFSFETHAIVRCSLPRKYETEYSTLHFSTHKIMCVVKIKINSAVCKIVE